MTTLTPLDQQRQTVRSFVAADQRRRQSETTARQQYAAGEKSAREQHAAAEYAAQQNHTAAIKRQDEIKSRQVEQRDSAASAIHDDWGQALATLGSLGVGHDDLPPKLEKSRAQPPAQATSEAPLQQLTATAKQIGRLRQSAYSLLLRQRSHQARQRRMLAGAAVVMVILAVAGYFYYQRWSYDQRVTGLYQAGVALLNQEDWLGARINFIELLSLEPGYMDVQGLLLDTYYGAGRTALDAGDWRTAQIEFGRLNELSSSYQDLQMLLAESYYHGGKAAVESGDWQAARDQLTEALRLQPDNVSVKELVNQHAEDIGLAFNPTDGAMYILIPAGEFRMGSPDGVGNANERPQHTVNLDDFWIMQTEVTNAQYAECVAAGACTAPSNTRWQDAAYADHPVANVNWNQANTYALWVGGRLPTEAEWEKAARGTDGRTYPWGNEQPDRSLTNCCRFVNDTTPVGSYPTDASPYGVMDMAGNVREWTADWFDSRYYGLAQEQNPSGPASGSLRVLRGGSYYNVEIAVRAASRLEYYPDSWDRGYGFRVASSSLGF